MSIASMVVSVRCVCVILVIVTVIRVGGCVFE